MRPFGGMKKMRTWFAADKTGFHMLHTLFQTSLKYNAVVRYDEWFVTKLLVDDGRVHGVDCHRARAPGEIDVIPAACGDPVHRRMRQGLSLHDQCRDQDRRRHGARLSGRRAAQGHGVRAVPSDRTALHRHPDHGSGARRRRVSDQQGRVSLPAGLRRSARRSRSRCCGRWSWGRATDCRRRSSRSWRKGGRSTRPTDRCVHLDLRHLGAEKIDKQAPVRPRAVPEVPEHRSGHPVDSGAAGRPLHDGRRAHGHQRRDAAGRAVCRRRGARA